jgi:hypothetical protein
MAEPQFDEVDLPSRGDVLSPEAQKGTVHPVPLRHVIVSHNPRWALQNLQSQGFDPMTLMQEYLLSRDADRRAHGCTLLEENEKEVIALADDLRTDQIVPVILRVHGMREIDGHRFPRFGCVDGESRLLGKAYNYAKHGDDAKVASIIKEMTEDEAYWYSVRANVLRRQYSDFVIGEILKKKADQDGLPLTEVARQLGLPYGYVRGRAALADPERLPPERREELERLDREGRLNITPAIQEALGENPAPSRRTPAERREGRRKTLTLKEVQELFDRTPRENRERLKAFAEVMMLRLDAAIEESDARLDDEPQRRGRRRA